MSTQIYLNIMQILDEARGIVSCEELRCDDFPKPLHISHLRMKIDGMEWSGWIVNSNEASLERRHEIGIRSNRECGGERIG